METRYMTFQEKTSHKMFIKMFKYSKHCDFVQYQNFRQQIKLNNNKA